MLILALPIVLVVGVIAHELCHAAAVKAVGGDLIRVDLWNLYVDYRVRSRREDIVVRHAPFVVGVLVAPTLLIFSRLSVAALMAVSTWGAFTLTGGEGEFGIVPKLG